jgi:imidazole glycerol-phosphate synthase subunit HisH
MSIALIDYGAGNLRSAAKAFEHAIAASGKRGRSPSPPTRGRRQGRPGRAARRRRLRRLPPQPRRVPGMVEAIASINTRGRPFLGICVGMQLLATRGIEHGISPGLDRFPARCAPSNRPIRR